MYVIFKIIYAYYLFKKLINPKINLLEKHYITMVKTSINKVVGSRGIVVNEFSLKEFTKL